MRAGEEFFNFYNHDFVRAAGAVPRARVADPAFNAREVSSLMEQAGARQVLVVLFPELCLSAYSCEGLFQQGALIEVCQMALGEIVERSRAGPIVGVVGVPPRADQHLYNCGVVLSGGRILGVVPKTYLPNYREFYEMRQFSPADTAGHDTVDDSGDIVTLSKQARSILDDAGLGYVQIFVSGGLDEASIDEYVAEGAPVDAFGVGTRMDVSADPPYLDMA